MVKASDVQKYAAVSKELKSHFQELFEDENSKKFEFRLYIVDNKDVNAFALPGGIVIFNKGLLKLADSVEEVYAVAAHEVAHVTLQHSLKQIIKTLGTYGFLQFVFGDFTGILAVLADNGTFLLTRMYSREAEEQADKKGFEMMLNQNVDPKYMVSFLKKLEEHHKKSSLSVTDLEKLIDEEFKKDRKSSKPTNEDKQETIKNGSNHLQTKPTGSANQVKQNSTTQDAVEETHQDKQDESKENKTEISDTEKIEKVAESVKEMVKKMDWLSTHPNTQNRISYLENELTKIPDDKKKNFRRIDMDWNQFKMSLNKAK
jgi:predicted Zn-dependent protease